MLTDLFCFSRLFPLPDCSELQVVIFFHQRIRKKNELPTSFISHNKCCSFQRFIASSTIIKGHDAFMMHRVSWYNAAELMERNKPDVCFSLPTVFVKKYCNFYCTNLSWLPSIMTPLLYFLDYKKINYI